MLLPLAPVLVFLAVFGRRLWRRGGNDWRLSAIESAIGVGVATIALTEILGRFGALKTGWVAALWTLAAAAALFDIWRTWTGESEVRKHAVIRLARCRSQLHSPPLEWIVVLIILVATGVTAWVSPPTNFDSMTYQFPRVMHWLQQGSTDHYPTSNVRQLSYGPGAVYWQLHLWSLWDGDRAANLVQWFASIGAAVGLSCWIRTLVPQRAIGLAVLVGLALPMSMLQASSSQTDLQVTAWILAALAILSPACAPRSSRFVWAGFAFGLAVLTKPVAALIGTPLALLFVWRHGCKNGATAGLRAACLIGAAGLTVCASHFWRNTHTFGSPLGSSGGTLLENHAPANLIGNGARWLMLNIPSVSIWQGTTAALETFGVDVNDPATTYQGLHFAPASPVVVHRLSLPDEDFAGYTRIILLIGLAAFFGRKRQDQLPAIGPWIIAIGIGVLLYPLLLKWQVWGNRLLLPAAWLGLPLLLARTGVAQFVSGRRAIALLLAANAAFVLIFSLNRPWVNLPESWQLAGDTRAPYAHSRDERFYLGYNEEAADVARRFATLAAEKNWRAIGLQTDWNYPEYVVWRALHEADMDHVQVHHIQTVPGRGLDPVPMTFNGYIETKSDIPPP